MTQFNCYILLALLKPNNTTKAGLTSLPLMRDLLPSFRRQGQAFFQRFFFGGSGVNPTTGSHGYAVVIHLCLLSDIPGPLHVDCSSSLCPSAFHA